MFSQFVKQSSRFLSADMPPARAQILHNPVVTRMKLNILKDGWGGGYGGQRWDLVLSVHLDNPRVNLVLHFYCSILLFVYAFVSFEHKGYCQSFSVEGSSSQH